MNRFILLLTISIVFSITFFACQDSSSTKKHAYNFYYWKAQWTIDSKSVDYLDSLSTQKLYLRFFDVHWEGNNYKPLAVLQIPDSIPMGLPEIIPVVYITNKVLYNVELEAIDSLAIRIAHKIESMSLLINNKPNWVQEIQLDCDWSLDTKDKYFRLLTVMRQQLPAVKNWSATIRLHQIKYFNKTGVPPVDKGVLMFYNMGEVANPEEKNSILNLETAEKYLQNLAVYPIKLDIALPLFNWGVQFRDGKILELINNLPLHLLKNNAKFRSIGEQQFEVLENQYLNGFYVYKGDQIRVESVSMEKLKKAYLRLQRAMKEKSFDLIFYHLDPIIQTNFTAKNLQDLGS